MKNRVLRFLAFGGVLIVLVVLTQAIWPAGTLGGLMIAGLALWGVFGIGWMLLWLWRRLTYRVGVRLVLSYLLLGVTPFLFCAALALFALYVQMGQYTSVRFGSEIAHRVGRLEAACGIALEAGAEGGVEAAADRLARVAADPPEPLSSVLWMVRLDGVERRGPGTEELPLPTWTERTPNGVVVHGSSAFLLATHRRGADLTAMLVPLDATTARAFNDAGWFDVYFFPGTENEDEAGAHLSLGTKGSTIRLDIDDAAEPIDEVWSEWPDVESQPWQGPWIFWFRQAGQVRELATGELVKERDVVTLLRTSAERVWRDFTFSRYELATELLGAFVGVATFFGVVYGMGVVVAVLMIFSIVRSTARLTRGAREVGRGNLDHRIPVRRHDQLGDLAASFNQMTASVQDMLSDVAEKERLARELELAREIQEGLLPDRHLRLGALELHATFRPAAEVGGDYFDVFQLSSERLIIAIGDVAGHGLPTGLLMATLKSSVAALVHEGYGGVELLGRVNRLLREQDRRRTLATLMVVEIDLENNKLALTNAGHPPAFVLHPDGAVDELMAGSVPIGSPLCRPVPRESSWGPGCRLVLYSDGLVEAADGDDEPFGYDRFANLLSLNSGLTGPELTAVVLGALDEYTGDRPLADDLTLLVLERGTAEE